MIFRTNGLSMEILKKHKILALKLLLILNLFLF